MKITHISAELAPIAHAGGLGDAVRGLTKSLALQNHTVEVILPYYQSIKFNIPGLTSKNVEKRIQFSTQLQKNTIIIEAKKFTYNGVDVTLLIFPKDTLLFNRSNIYGYDDDITRFISFCTAAKDYLIQETPPDIVHLHDWHTGLLAYFLEDLPCKTVFTIHNFSYAGYYSPTELQNFNLSEQSLSQTSETEGSFSLLKLGLAHADCVTTVSPTYAKEILSDPTNHAMTNVILKSKTKITGILNGIDFEYWNPETDPFLKSHYCLQNIENHDRIIEAKKLNRKKLSKKTGLSFSQKPLIGLVSRLTEQKGLSFIKTALLNTLEQDCQMIIMGSCTDPGIENIFYKIKKNLDKTHNISINLSYDEKTAHLIYAAADIILIPSLFEPCGLSQLIAMRYGAIPVVTRTGGLSDTVQPDINGFMFEPAHDTFISTLMKAIDVKINHKTQWNNMMREGMLQDSDWTHSATRYCELYQNLF